MNYFSFGKKNLFEFVHFDSTKVDAIINPLTGTRGRVQNIFFLCDLQIGPISCCVSLPGGFSSLVQCLWITRGAYP
jgi:hypothetical protein